MGKESTDMENMYEGKNIEIILDRKNLDNFVIREFVLNENINEHQKLEVQLEMDDEQRKSLEKIIEKENVEIEIELSGMNQNVKKKIFGSGSHAHCRRGYDCLFNKAGDNKEQ